MKYELDFIDSSENSKSADAVILRFWPDDSQNEAITLVFDSGTKASGNQLVDIMNKYYRSSPLQKPVIDYLFCSHPHQDHCGGFKQICEECEVKNIFCNPLENYVKEVQSFLKDYGNSLTIDKIKQQLENDGASMQHLIGFANSKRKKTYQALQGNFIHPNIKILSPSKEFLVYCLAGRILGDRSRMPQEGEIFEEWDNELITEDTYTSFLNEASVVLYVDLGNDKLLLTGDAGPKALQEAICYARQLNLDLKDVNILQMPHHGSRHNITPSILNDIIGDIKPQTRQSSSSKIAYVCSGCGEEHPHQMAVNAFIRRGCSVIATQGNVVYRYSGNGLDREGWGPVSSLIYVSNYYL